jgi:hypothetical protein
LPESAVSGDDSGALQGATETSCENSSERAEGDNGSRGSAESDQVMESSGNDRVRRGSHQSRRAAHSRAIRGKRGWPGVPERHQEGRDAGAADKADAEESEGRDLVNSDVQGTGIAKVEGRAGLRLAQRLVAGNKLIEVPKGHGLAGVERINLGRQRSKRH